MGPAAVRAAADPRAAVLTMDGDPREQAQAFLIELLRQLDRLNGNLEALLGQMRQDPLRASVEASVSGLLDGLLGPAPQPTQRRRPR